MDTFRRFQSRRKSKGQTDGFTTFADADSSYRSGSSNWKTSTSRTSATVPRPSDVTLGREVSDEQSRPRNSSTEYSPQRSSARIQPMLVGVSRPFATKSRPGTAESMQLALDRAAEAVSRQQTKSTAPSSPRPMAKTGRYIDIFATSDKPIRMHSEDVAERNLDTPTAVSERKSPAYKPTSRYQEEVAARNAHHIVTERAASAHGPNASDRLRTSPGRSSSALSGNYSPQCSMSPNPARSRQPPDTIAYHSRQHGPRPKEDTRYLPSIPQRRSREDSGAQLGSNINSNAVMIADKELETAKARWREVRRQHYANMPTDVEKPLPASPRRKDLSQHLGITRQPSEVKPLVAKRETLQGHEVGTQSHNIRTRSSHVAQQFVLSDSLARDDSGTGRIQQNRPRNNPPKGGDKLRPSVSMSQQSSYRRTQVGNRMIMDLTGEEAVESASMASHLNPANVEDAHSVAFQTVVPMVGNSVSSPYIVDQIPVVPANRWSSSLEPVLDLDQLARRSRVIAETETVTASDPKPKHQHRQGEYADPPPASKARRSHMAPPPSTLAFSPISTLTSSSPPRVITFSSISTLTSTSPRSSQEWLVESLDVSRAQEANGSSTTDGHDPQLTAPRPNEQSNARFSANIAPMVRVFADVTPEYQNTANSTGSGRPKLDSLRSDSDRKRKESTVSTRKSSRTRERFEEKELIREAAKSKIPAGPLDQEPSPGIKARDFAMDLLEKPMIKRIDTLSERKLLLSEPKKSSRDHSGSSKSSSSDRKGKSRATKTVNKVTFSEDTLDIGTSLSKLEKPVHKKTGKKSNKDKSSTGSTTKPKSLFDEVAHKKKHAEANAALIRLQQSLQEPFEQDLQSLATLQKTDMATSRALSPADGASKGASPIPPSSSTTAALVMITTATSSLKSQSRPRLGAKADSDIGKNIRVAKPAPAVRANTHDNVPIIRNATLAMNNPALARIDLTNNGPPSPGAISLSNFPIPAPRDRSPDQPSKSPPPIYVKDIGAPVRRGSQASRMSSSSAFNIPFTMVPGRMASLPENRMGAPDPSATDARQQMDSIASVLPELPG